MKANRSAGSLPRAGDAEHEGKGSRRKGKSPFDELLGAVSLPHPAAAPPPAAKPSAPPRSERKRGEGRETAPLGSAPIAAAPPPLVQRAPEISAPAPVRVPRAALEDPALLVSVRPGSATVRVQPTPDSAAVTLRIGVQQGVATVRAEGAASAQLLGGHQRELEAALARQGLQLGALELPPVEAPKRPPPPARRRGRPFHQQA